MKWPNENGKPVAVKNLTNEQLLVDTQRLVDAHRRRDNDRLYDSANDMAEYDPVVIHEYSKPLKFTGLLKRMVRECQKRGVPVNTDR